MEWNKFVSAYELVKCHEVSKVLNAKGFRSYVFADCQDAVERIIDLVKSAKTIGIPGSVTIRELGLIERLESEGLVVYQHWDPNLAPDQVNCRFLDANNADYFITGCNAITMKGQLVNIDGRGNRVSAMMWGPGKIIYVVGSNKICSDVEGALDRIKNQSAPPNSARVGTNPPCVAQGKCVDCRSPERGCRVTTIMDYPPFGRECYVILIAKRLGY